MGGIVYILRSLKDYKTYVGSTDNLERRKLEHDKGLVKSTRERRPLVIIYQETFLTLIEARAREKFLKTSSGRRLLKRIISSIQRGRAIGSSSGP